MIALGVIIAILYFGRVFFITAHHRGDHRVHPGAVRDAADAPALPAQPGQLRGVQRRAAVSLRDRAWGLTRSSPPSTATCRSTASASATSWTASAEGSGRWSRKPTACWFPRGSGSRNRSACRHSRPPKKRAAAPGAPRQPPQPPPTGAAAIPEVRIHEESTPIGDYVFAHLSSFYQILLMASFIPFLVYFMLSWRDHINRSFLQFFHGEDRLVAARSLQGIAEMVRAFVVGNFLLGLLLAVLSSVMFWLMRLPYPAAGGAAERISEPGAVRGPAAGHGSAAVRGAGPQPRPDLRAGDGDRWRCCT